MKTLGLEEAAKLLRVHPKTLARRAATGEVPGVKEGRAWVFVEVDLIEHLRAKYRRRVSEGAHEDASLCHSTDAKTHPCGGWTFPSAASEYSEVLGLPNARKRRNTTTG